MKRNYFATMLVVMFALAAGWFAVNANPVEVTTCIPGKVKNDKHCRIGTYPNLICDSQGTTCGGMTVIEYPDPGDGEAPPVGN